MFDYVARLYGICLEGEQLLWNCRLPDDATRSEYRLQLPAGEAVLTTTREQSVLALGDRVLARVNGECRIVSDARGEGLRLVGTALEPASVRIDGVGTVGPVRPNQYLSV
jgi:hypothetical protein